MDDFWFAIIMGSLGANIVLLKNIKVKPIEVPSGSSHIALILMSVIYGTIMAV